MYGVKLVTTRIGWLIMAMAMLMAQRIKSKCNCQIVRYERDIENDLPCTPASSSGISWI